MKRLFCILFCACLFSHAAEWELKEGGKVEGVLVGLTEGGVIIRDGSGQERMMSEEDFSANTRKVIKTYKTGKIKDMLEALRNAFRVIDLIQVPQKIEFPLTGKGVVNLVAVRTPEIRRNFEGGMIEKKAWVRRGGMFYYQQKRIVCFPKEKVSKVGMYFKRGSVYYSVIEKLMAMCNWPDGSPFIYTEKDMKGGGEMFTAWRFDMEEKLFPVGVSCVVEGRTRISADNGRVLSAEEEMNAVEFDMDRTGSYDHEAIFYLIFLDEKWQLKYGMVSLSLGKQGRAIFCFDKDRKLAPVDWFGSGAIKMGKRYYDECFKPVKK